ncbi:MAG: glycine cleavage system aminomethyltransferase GcvT, partial [Verrucomicrobiaceae bacterium]
MVPFAGWKMPVQYTGITEEHQAVRSGVGIFDISHMGQFLVSGPASMDWLNGLLTNGVHKLEEGQGQYTLMLNERGGVIDDLIVYRTGPEDWFLVVNASKIAEDREWMQARLVPDVAFTDESPAFAGMAVQGPQAVDVFGKALPGERMPSRNGVAMIDRRNGGKCVICRTGYTGEDGFEFFCPAAEGPEWWDTFVAAGARPCGLGARDTLRLEMGYPLNGNDLSPDRTPLEAGLGFFVDLDKGAFVGRTVLTEQKANGLPSKLTGVRVTEKGPPIRAHYAVFAGGEQIGELCSGGVAPSLGGAGIGMAYLPPDFATPGKVLEIDVRGRRFAAETVKKPFYR